MEVNIREIFVFFKILDAGSIAEAAEQMFITKQAVNKQIKLLEERFGAKLIERKQGRKEVSPTEMGQRIWDCYRETYDKYVEGNAKLEEYYSKRKNVIYVGYFNKIKENEVLMPIVNNLQQRTEICDIQLMAGELGEVLQWVENGVCDVAITNIHDAEKRRRGIEYVPIAEEKGCIFVSSEHPWAKKDEVTVSDIRTGTLLVIPWNEELEKACIWRRIQTRKKKKVPDVKSMVPMVKTGEYFIISAEYLADTDAKLIKKELPPEYELKIETCLIYRKENRWIEVLENLIIESPGFLTK